MTKGRTIRLRTCDFRVILGPCGSPFTSPTFRRTPAPSCASPPASGLEAHIIEPTGFPSSDRAFRRAGMDYLDQVSLTRHVSWAAFDAWRRAERLRLVLFTTAAERSYLDHAYRRDDILLFGRESSGVPPSVHEAADARLKIPMREGLRSLNVAMAAAMAAGEVLRQTRARPWPTSKLYRPQQAGRRCPSATPSSRRWRRRSRRGRRTACRSSGRD